MARNEKAFGIPDKRKFGRVTNLQPGQIYDFIVQEHLAERAGKHFDIRLGDTVRNYLSWAIPKAKLPKPKEKVLAVRTQLHSPEGAEFEGVISEGYGKGRVKKVRQGRVLVTDVTPTKITFTTADTKYPERFALIKLKNKDQWILINTTPTKLRKYKKIHFKTVDPTDIERLFSPKYMAQIKLDGSAAWYEIIGDKIELLSYRPQKRTRYPIIHTERAGLYKVKAKGKVPEVVLRGEIFAVDSTGKAIPAAELGGILNATIENALKKLKEGKITLKHAIFDIVKHPAYKKIQELPYSERLKIIRQIISKFPKDTFMIPEGTTDPKQQKELWKRVKSKKHPLTYEGLVFHPLEGGKPTKVKQYKEMDVIIYSIFPGTGKYKNAAGGFYYALPDNPTKPVGKVGTGFSDEIRKAMWENPNDWIGRIARVKYQEQFKKTKALRAPVFIALHEG